MPEWIRVIIPAPKLMVLRRQFFQTDLHIIIALPYKYTVHHLDFPDCRRRDSNAGKMMSTRIFHFAPACTRILYSTFINSCGHLLPPLASVSLSFFPRCSAHEISCGVKKVEHEEVFRDRHFRHPVDRTAGLTQESYLLPAELEPRRQSYGINTLTYSFSKLLPFQS